MPGRNWVLTAQGQAAILRDVPTGRIVRELKGHTDDVNSVAVTADGKRAVTRSDHRTARVWDLETGRTLRELKGRTDDVSSVAVTTDGKRAATGGGDRTTRVGPGHRSGTLRSALLHGRRVGGHGPGRPIRRFQ